MDAVSNSVLLVWTDWSLSTTFLSSFNVATRPSPSLNISEEELGHLFSALNFSSTLQISLWSFDCSVSAVTLSVWELSSLRAWDTCISSRCICLISWSPFSVCFASEFSNFSSLTLVALLGWSESTSGSLSIIGLSIDSVSLCALSLLFVLCSMLFSVAVEARSFFMLSTEEEAFISLSDNCVISMFSSLELEFSWQVCLPSWSSKISVSGKFSLSLASLDMTSMSGSAPLTPGSILFSCKSKLTSQLVSTDKSQTLRSLSRSKSLSSCFSLVFCSFLSCSGAVSSFVSLYSLGTLSPSRYVALSSDVAPESGCSMSVLLGSVSLPFNPSAKSLLFKSFSSSFPWIWILFLDWLSTFSL